MAEVTVDGQTIHLDLPLRVADFTLRLRVEGVQGILVDGKPLTQAANRVTFKSGTFFTEGQTTLVAFDPVKRRTRLQIQTSRP